MFGIGEGELAIILVFGFLLFGPDKLPQMGRTIGRALRQFRETQEKMTSVVQSEIIDPVTEAAQAPVKPARVEESDDDADDDDAESAPAVKETFAERRARLAAEKAAKEAAEAGDDAEGTEAAEAAEGKGTEEACAQVDESTAEPEDDAEAEKEDDEPAEESEPEIRTTADLYARRPHKRKWEVVEDLARELADDDAEKGGEE